MRRQVQEEGADIAGQPLTPRGENWQIHGKKIVRNPWRNGGGDVVDQPLQLCDEPAGQGVISHPTCNGIGHVYCVGQQPGNGQKGEKAAVQAPSMPCMAEFSRPTLHPLRCGAGAKASSGRREIVDMKIMQGRNEHYELLRHHLSTAIM